MVQEGMRVADMSVVAVEVKRIDSSRMWASARIKDVRLECLWGISKEELTMTLL